MQQQQQRAVLRASSTDGERLEAKRERESTQASERDCCVCVCAPRRWQSVARSTLPAFSCQPDDVLAHSHTHRQTSSMHWSRLLLLLLLLMAVAPARCLLERVRGLGSHTAHTHRCCKRAHLLRVPCCWGEKSAGKATKEEEEAQEQRLWWWWWCGKRVCAASAAPVCVCVRPRSTKARKGSKGKERQGKGGAALAKHAAGHWWSRVLSASPWPLRASLLSVCVCVSG